MLIRDLMWVDGEDYIVSRWISLLKVSVVHEYFGWKICPSLEFLPSAGCCKALKRDQLLMKQYPGGFELLANLSEDICRIEQTFRFYGYSSDPCFAAYTQLPGGGRSLVYYRIECGDTDTSLVESESAPVLEDGDVARNPRTGVKPNLIVDVVMAKTLGPEVNAICAIELRARQLYWKYILGGELSVRDLEIRDFSSDMPLGFERYEQDLSRAELVFQSLSPIVLQESPPQRIQLVEAGSGKVVIKRLPNAGPWQLGKSRDRNGNEVVVAEIFVNQ